MENNREFVQLHIDLLKNLNVKNCNIYILSKNVPKLIKKKGEPLRKNLMDKLQKYKTEEKNKVLIEKNDVWETFKYFNLNIPVVSKNPEIQREAIDRVFSLTETMYEALMADPKKENFKIAAETNRIIAKFIEYNPSIVKLTVSTLKKDVSTIIHTRNVQILVSGFVFFLGITGQRLKNFVNGAFFHDIGKLKIENEILKKPGKLSSDEFEIMKNHTVYGYEILKKNNLGEYAVMALNHHEYLDGSGYPNAKEDKEISFHARVIQICDIFEALTGLRPYRTPMGIFEALELIKSNFVETGKIDEDLYEKFLHYLKNNMA
jgi:HD-GYP domain-containing protein (c-di-GMP phosphodiesterase class II)